ncbi:hypothetical protein L211DRAFT_837668, partial [Terfezia boudieri ATCC MYA-4762]
MNWIESFIIAEELLDFVRRRETSLVFPRGFESFLCRFLKRVYKDGNTPNPTECERTESKKERLKSLTGGYLWKRGSEGVKCEAEGMCLV